MYNVFGGIAPREHELKFLSGYFGFAPGADRQWRPPPTSARCLRRGDRRNGAICEAHGNLDRVTQKVLIGLGKHLAKHWDVPDEGIWEPRGRRENHTHSRLLCWTGVRPPAGLCEKGMLSGAPREEFLRERERIRQQIETRAWNEKIQSYVSTLDGEAWMPPCCVFHGMALKAADSKRMKLTYRRVCEQLGSGNGLLYRYPRDRRKERSASVASGRSSIWLWAEAHCAKRISF